jgi:hypothetical protein
MLRIFIICILSVVCLHHNLSGQSVWEEDKEIPYKKDWLVSPPETKADIYISKDSKDITLYNGLVKRTFRLRPNLVCIDYSNMTNGQQLLRALKPEAIITINHREYNIGGLHGETENAYLLPEWLDKFTAGGNDFQFLEFEITDIPVFVHWKPRGWVMNKNQATGKRLSFSFQSLLPEIQHIIVKVNYELYDGIPLIIKSVSVENRTRGIITLNRVVNEVIAVVEEESAVVGTPDLMKKQHGLYVETNYAFNNAMCYDISDQTTHWEPDSAYRSQVNYNFQTPCLLKIYPEKVTGVEVEPNEIFTSVRSCELLMDSYDRERRGLAIRRMYRTIAPWTTENPIFMHLVSKNDEEVRKAIDQCAVTGYEAVILSFGSHCDMEDLSDSNLKRWEALAAYAHSKNILLGGYSLFSSRRISDEDDVIDPASGKPDLAAFFGYAPCLGSKWGLNYLEKLKNFLTRTGFDILENDGPYPGDLCASTKHPGHKNVDDSQWKQMELQKDFYHWCSAHAVYVNAPDWYFLDGSNKTAIGYREVNFSLPRENQKILNRQNIYDGLWEKTPSMSWGFVPLTKYQGGGADAVLEPLAEHLKDYNQLMFQYYGSGVQACYRGPRLFDSDSTRQMVTSLINWYKKYRYILNSDIIHLRRADGRDWDGIMHVNPGLSVKAMVLLYNPLKKKITRTIRLPLYYTGLTENAVVREKEGRIIRYPLNRNYEIALPVSMEPESYTWLTIE